MSGSAAELAHRLAREAEAVCRHYLSNGRRQGRYWLVGDVQNSPGRSLFVRLAGPDSGRGAAGKWTDAATGQHGDLLDLIRLNRGLDRLGEALGEARAFFGLPKPELSRALARAGSSDAARRLFAMSRPIVGTLADTYLRNRGITVRLEDVPAVRFHPGCFYRAHDAAPREVWPALIAAVTDAAGAITGVHRTWLDRDGAGKAPIATPRRALGHLLGNAVRFGVASDLMIAGEGIETMLSLRCVLPNMPMAAALSANHLTALILPPALRRLYIARDNDAAGIEARILWPVTNDFNADLRRFGADALLVRLRVQLTPEDAERFASRGKIAAARHPPLCSGRPRSAWRCSPGPAPAKGSP